MAPTSTGRKGYVGIDRRWLADPNLSDSALRLMMWLESHSDEYLAAMNMQRAAKEIGWTRNRIKRTLEELHTLGLVSTEQLPRRHGGTVTRFTLHLGAWSDGPSRTTAMVNHEARAVVHGEARTTSTPNGLETNTQNAEHTGNQQPSTEQGWESFWEQYPRKQGKAEARKRWGKMTATERAAVLELLPDWCRAYTTVDPKFIPHASTWLNQRRWDDPVPRTQPEPEPQRPAKPVWCDDCEGTGWVEVEDASLRAGVGMAKCHCQTATRQRETSGVT